MVYQISVVVLFAFAAGGVVYVLLLPYLSGEKKVEKRVKNLTARDRLESISKNSSFDNSQARRQQVQDTLSELEKKQKDKSKVTVRMLIEQAGIQMTTRNFYLTSVVLAVVAGFGAMLSGVPIYVTGAAAAAAGIGLPRWGLSFLAKKRQKKFTEEFVNAVDIIVRGVKSGLPLNDCLKIIAAETQEPVRSEFVYIVEQQRLGLTIPQALERLYERIPLEEVNFFVIVITIQQESGGNLADALTSLSGVLRDRKKLKGKIAAFSAEAKASAGIIAALPVAVMGLVYITTPEYISILWTHPTGHMLLAGSAVWMIMGVLVMRNMINFEY